METIKPQHRDFKTFFQGTKKTRDIEIPQGCKTTTSSFRGVLALMPPDVYYIGREICFYNLCGESNPGPTMVYPIYATAA